VTVTLEKGLGQFLRDGMGTLDKEILGYYKSKHMWRRGIHLEYQCVPPVDNAMKQCAVLSFGRQ